MLWLDKFWLSQMDWLNVGTFSMFKMDQVGTVPIFKMHHEGTLKFCAPTLLCPSIYGFMWIAPNVDIFCERAVSFVHSFSLYKLNFQPMPFFYG